MSTRNIKDAKDLNTGELIYFKGHAKAIYMSDGRTVEEAINSSGSGGASITVDSSMSDSSTNPVQNKVVKAYVDNAITNSITNAINASY